MLIGNNTIVINNCSFSDIYTGEDIPTTYDYNYEDDYYSSFNYNNYEDFINGNFKLCNHKYSCMSKIKIHYHFANPEIDQTANKLLFSDCHFINNFRTAKVLHV